MQPASACAPCEGLPCAAGYRIPKGTNIICSFWAVQRDPKIWRDPESFQPQRWVPGSPEHVTEAEEKAWFGFGAWPCVLCDSCAPVHACMDLLSRSAGCHAALSTLLRLRRNPGLPLVRGAIGSDVTAQVLVCNCIQVCALSPPARDTKHTHSRQRGQAAGLIWLQCMTPYPAVFTRWPCTKLVLFVSNSDACARADFVTVLSHIMPCAAPMWCATWAHACARCCTG